MTEASKGGFEPDEAAWKDAHLALGAFLSAWGDLENIVFALFRDFWVSDRQIASTIFSHMTTRSQIQCVKDLLSDMAPSAEVAQLLRLISRLGDASGRRNSIVHAHWSLLTPPPKLYRVSQSVTDKGTNKVIAGIRGRREAQSYRAKNAFTVAEIKKETASMRRLRSDLQEARASLARGP